MQCPVCGNDTFKDDDFEYNICSECFWEYDTWQVNNPDSGGGANCHSLNEYRKIYSELKRKNLQFSCRNESDRLLIVRADREKE
ncbi:MAG: hypothetical protein IJX24_02935 [Oscillospiraceae bacterium]|nr:hypothetical protein [Oscillospiraceae bacterium]